MCKKEEWMHSYNFCLTRAKTQTNIHTTHRSTNIQIIIIYLDNHPFPSYDLQEEVGK